MPVTESTAPTLSLDVFRLIRDMLYEHCGVWLDDDSKFFVEGRLQDMIRRRRLRSFKELYYFLKYDSKREEEFAAAVDVLTIHETYFFREDRQLQALAGEIIPELIADRAPGALRIWSAGCSTGEEVYSLAILLAERSLPPDWRLEIMGSDISHRVLEIARRGVYPLSAFRSAPPEWRLRYFHRDESGFRIDEAIKRRVSFFSLNLLDDARASLLPPIDVILCRNVIIYFDGAAKKRVVETFARRLRAGGFLLLGHSESLVNVSTAFRLRHLSQDIVYQRPGAVEAVHG